jgi:hypothetical protein
MAATMLHWLNANSGAITALATLILVLITAAYVLITYLLVREQRNQLQTPEVARFWADTEDSPNADLRLHNIGDGTAAEVMIVRGPMDCIDVEMPDLGTPKALFPGEDFIWRIQPRGEEGETFPVGDLCLTLKWFDNPRNRAYFDVFILRVEAEGKGVVVNDLGSASKFWTARELRKLTGRSLSLRSRPRFHWKARRKNLTLLLLDDDVRRALRDRLTRGARELNAWNSQAELFRDRL